MKTRTFINTALLTLLGATMTARADVITDWNVEALNAIRGNRTPPPKASRSLAMLHAAMYDAVNGISHTHEACYVRKMVPIRLSREAAASAAAHEVLSALFPTNTPSFNALHTATLAGIPDSARKRVGVRWGQNVGNKMLASRAKDGSDATVVPPTGTGPGFWEPTPPAFAAYLLPQWGFVKPFAMKTGSQFRPPGPPALDSAEYAADYNEVKALGAAVGSTRTSDQTQIAQFWADGAGTETPPGHWNTIARQVVSDGIGATIEESARLFALLNIAMADAAICSWDAKYTFNFWRPITAIRKGDTDGNPATDPDPTWSSLIGTPPFPDYTSGHSTFSGAAATVLAMFYRTDNVYFMTGSDALPGVTRAFTSFSDAAAEAADSRLYGGIHYRSANEDGLAAGLEIGEWTFTRFLRPRGHRPRN